MAERRRALLPLGMTAPTEHDPAYRVVAAIETRPMYQPHQRASRTYRKRSTNHLIVPFDAIDVSVTSEVVNPRKRRSSPDFWVSGGASLEPFRQVVEPVDGLTLADIARLADLGDRWHLNGMVAGCAHQTVVWAKNERYGHMEPSLDLTPRCPVTGYRYGHEWLGEVIPADALAEIRAFMARGAETVTDDG